MKRMKAGRRPGGAYRSGIIMLGLQYMLSAVAWATLAPPATATAPTTQATAPSAPADPKSRPVISWFGGNYPPTFITSGPHKGRGYGDRALEHLFEKMPGFRHVRLETTFNRGLAALRERDGACMFGVIRTPERAGQFAFSAPVTATLPNRVIMLKSRASAIAPFLNPAGEVMLEDLVLASGLRLGLITERFYSPHINAVLAAHTGGDRVTLPAPRYGTLLYHRRIDYTFGYPYEAAFQFADLGEPDAFISFPISGEPALLRAHVACSDTSLGREVTAAANRAIKAEGTQEAIYGYFMEWLDEAAKTDFLKAIAASDRPFTEGKPGPETHGDR